MQYQWSLRALTQSVVREGAGLRGVSGDIWHWINRILYGNMFYNTSSNMRISLKYSTQITKYWRSYLTKLIYQYVLAFHCIILSVDWSLLLPKILLIQLLLYLKNKPFYRTVSLKTHGFTFGHPLTRTFFTNFLIRTAVFNSALHA